MAVVDALVLAGGDGTAIEADVACKGLARVAGRPMAEWVAAALGRAECVREVAVVAPTREGFDGLDRDTQVVVSDGSFMENLVAGFDALSGDRPVLVATGDIPALTSEAVDDFVAQAVPRDPGFAYAFIARSDMEAGFPGSVRTYLPTTLGPVTGGNLALLTHDAVRRNREFGQRLFDTRKSASAMAKLLGPRILLALASKRLQPSTLERRMGELLGTRCAAVHTQHACIGADVDKLIDREVVERVLDRIDG